MKTPINFITLILISWIISGSTFGQSFYKVIGEDDGLPAEFVMRFEVLDQESYTPIRNAQVTIKNNNGGKFLSLRTSQNGICIIVVMNDRLFPSSGTIRVTAEDYKYWKDEFDIYYFQHNRENYPFAVYGMESDWTGPPRPNAMQIISALNEGNYEMVDQNNYYGNGSPGCYEYSVKLEMIPRDQRISDNYYHSRNDNYRERNDYNSHNKQSQIPTIRYNGETIYVFPNDLSGGLYHCEQAKNACNSLNHMGYDDWYLPSKEELNILYLNKEEIGGFTNGWYWSSTESSYNRIWGQSFEDGIQETEYKGTTYNIHKGNIKVRCIRK